MTITRRIREKLEKIRLKITKETSINKMNFGEVVDFLVDFYKKHSEPEDLPLIVSGRTTIFRGRSIIIPKKKEVINAWK